MYIYIYIYFSEGMFMYFFCECKADKRERRAPDLRQYLVCPQVRPSRARGLLRTWIDIQGSRGTDGRPGLGPVWSCIHVQKGSTNSIKHSHTMLQGTFHRAACTHHDLLQEQIASILKSLPCHVQFMCSCRFKTGSNLRSCASECMSGLPAVPPTGEPPPPNPPGWTPSCSPNHQPWALTNGNSKAEHVQTKRSSIRLATGWSG